MPTFTPTLRTSKINAKGTAPMYIRISDVDGSRYVSLRRRVRPSQWDAKKGRALSNHADYKKLNRLIEKRVEALKDEAFRAELDGHAPTASDLKESYRNAYHPAKPETSPEAGYFALADHVVDEKERRGEIRTHNRYKSVTKKFRAFAGEPLPFASITPRLLRDFETHLIEQYGNAPGTIASNMRVIRAVVYAAIRDGAMEQGANPFFHYKISRPRSKRTKLSREQIAALEGLDLEEGSLLYRVRDYFLFSLYCAGIRFGDFAELRGTDFSELDGIVWIDYTMSKTKGRRRFPLGTQAADILKTYCEVGQGDYAFPPLRNYDLSTPRKRINAISAQNALANKYLKKLAALTEIEENVTFHVSRHSFAEIARTSDWSVYDIAALLGRASVKTTEAYLKSLDGVSERSPGDLFT